jgi:hypothetical protein
MRVKYTPEMLERIVVESETFADVVRRLGLKMSGGNHSHIKKRVEQYNIDTSHFKKSVDFLKPGVNKRSAEDVLVLRECGNRENAARLRRVMIESGVKYECCDCSLKDKWNDKLLVLEVNHKNGNWLDNRLGNLEFLCPNCHSQYVQVA